MEDFLLVGKKLITSYTRQIEYFEDLNVLGQKILGKLTLSRGDFTGVMVMFEEKNEISKFIEKERESIRESVVLWQDNKDSLSKYPILEDVDLILDKMEIAIKTFLDTEDQLKKYLEHSMVDKGNVAGV